MKFKNLISTILIGVICLSLINIFSCKVVLADSFISVTLGADLKDSQKAEMLDYFNVTKDTSNILTVTSKEEYESLGKIATSTQLGNKAISCSYVKPTSDGGLDVTTHNLNWVTEGMIKNALITAGIKNAKVVAAAPFEVSGTAALTGILKGFESSFPDEKISEEQKDAANEELFVTGEIGDKIGKNDATNLLNDIKKEIIEKNPTTEKKLNSIIDNIISDYDYDLNDDDINKIKSAMSKINDLDIDYNSIKDQLNNVAAELKDKVNVEKVTGFFESIGNFFKEIGNFFKSLWNSISNFFS